ncbi:IS1182 family transposase [Schleiferilactobacillus shenzhenensis]|nr:IS1182 family transposase [Schleiferilactobacillus shenzhenensis]
MQTHYNMDQLVLDITTAYVPAPDHVVHHINDLVEAMDYQVLYQTGRPREFDPRAMMKLVLFAYLRGNFSCRRIAQFAEENINAMWLTQEQKPSYRTIARFVVSNEAQEILQSSLDSMVQFLKAHGLIDDVSFIDGTKILANANKYSFVWNKNTIRYDELNRTQAEKLIAEIKQAEAEAFAANQVFDYDHTDEIVARLENRKEELNVEVEATKKVSPNPARQKRRANQGRLGKMKRIKEKRDRHIQEKEILGERNSYSKTDHDATFMHVKEDPMGGEAKPAYNLQIATSNQFVTGYAIFQNPSDIRTLVPFIRDLAAHDALGHTIVADAGYGSEIGYRTIEDEFEGHTALIPYGTMLKENSRKWRSDDSKVMNWAYHELDDYYEDPRGVRFNFHRYVKQVDAYGDERQFKEYQAEDKDENGKTIPAALTKGGRRRQIKVNPSWEYFKAQMRERLSEPKNAMIYAQRQIDAETVFGNLKAYLGFKRFTVRGIKKVKNQIGFALMALNMKKMAEVRRSSSFIFEIQGQKSGQVRKSRRFSNLAIIFEGFCHAPEAGLEDF